MMIFSSTSKYPLVGHWRHDYGKEEIQVSQNLQDIYQSLQVSTNSSFFEVLNDLYYLFPVLNFYSQYQNNDIATENSIF